MATDVPPNPPRRSGSMVTQEMIEEVSAAIAVRNSPPTTPFQTVWGSWLRNVLTILIGSATIAGVLGKAFFVSRADYDARVQADLVTAEAMRQTLLRLDRTLAEQAAAFGELNRELVNVKINMAGFQAVTRRP